MTTRLIGMVLVGYMAMVAIVWVFTPRSPSAFPSHDQMVIYNQEAYISDFVLFLVIASCVILAKKDLIVIENDKH